MPIQKIEDLIDSLPKSKPELITEVNINDHFELARLLHQLSPEGKIHVFNNLNSDLKRQEVLYETDIDSRLEIESSLGSKGLTILLSSMPEDEATDIIQELGVDEQKKILSQMEVKDAVVIKDLITYKEETAGGLMVPKFNSVKENQTASEILMQLKHENNSDIPPYFYVVETKNKLKGYFKVRDLLNVSTNTKAAQIMRKVTPKVFTSDSCDKVAKLMDNEHLSTIPVVDENNAIRGVITFSAVIGSTAPILFIKINVDPAISSGPFVTVTNDIAGIAIYLLTTSYIYSAI